MFLLPRLFSVGTDRQEHQRLGHRMEYHQQDPCPNGLIHPHARAGRNQSQIRNRRISQHLLSRRSARLASREVARNVKPPIVVTISPARLPHSAGSQAQQQIHACLDHRSRMQQRAGRRRRHHRSQEPSRKRQLRALRQPRKGQQNDRNRSPRNRRLPDASATRLCRSDRMQLHARSNTIAMAKPSPPSRFNPTAPGTSYGLASSD